MGASAPNTSKSLKEHMPSPRPPRARTKADSALVRGAKVRADSKAKAAPAPAPPSLRTSRRREVGRASPVGVGDSAELARLRAAYRVAFEDTTVCTSLEAIPEIPGESGGLLELVPAVARRALELGLRAKEPSFHIFVAAEPEVKVEEDVVRHASRVAAAHPTPNDIAYVHDFDRPEAPLPLIVPPGAGPALVAAVDALVEQLKGRIPAVVDGDEFKRAQAQLASELETKNRAVIHDLESVAKSLGFGVRPVHGGVQTFPMLHGKPVSAEQFDVLDDSTKRALTASEAKLTREVDRAAQSVRAQSARIDAAREVAFSRAAAAIVAEAVKGLEPSFALLGEDARAWLVRVEKALAEDWEDLVEPDEEEEERGKPPREEKDDPELATRLNRFKVNLLVSNPAGSPAPVIYDTNPTYPNLFGYLERRARYGALLTDFTRIRAGSLHRASGGALVVRAADLLTDPIIWERFKRVLREQRIGAEDPLGPLGLYATSLRPVPAPIHVRVVLVGSHELHATLLDADPDFASLFRVKVEVDATIPRTPESLVALDAHLMAMAEERAWGRFDRAARATLLDLATRLAADREKLALTLSPLEETMAFASAMCTGREAVPGSRGEGVKAARIGAQDVRAAWIDRRERAGSAERHIREITLRGEVALDTSGWRTGVVNGLSVFSTGDVEFGQPMRITAVVGIGREGLIDVEREAQLGGSIHTKGVAILRGYLARMFGQERPLSLRAQLAFEQSYGEIDGDSASSSELFALLSAIADVGIDQGVAVTGSVNQLGEMQAIGGICAKVEGFFDLCNARGLTGRQGVLIPSANRPHLVLRDDVAQAVAAGRFHLYAVDLATQGIEVLTGLPAGERDEHGRFPASSVFGRVERRIIEIAERLRDAEGGHYPAHDMSDGRDDGGHADAMESTSAQRR
jgi:predicted ATP-dependent protease